jgi:hypothetical protein
MPGFFFRRVGLSLALITSLAGASLALFAASPTVAEPLNAALSGTTSLTAPDPVGPIGPTVRSRQPSSARFASRAPAPVATLPSTGPAPLSLPLPTEPAARPASTSTGCLPAQLKQAIADVQSRFGPVEVVSTHRPGARISGTGHRSLHASCQAVDFRPARGTYGAVASYLRTNWQGGVGTYSSGHIHIDTGANYQWHHGAARGEVRVARRR